MKTQKSFFEQNGGTFSQVGDVLLRFLSSTLILIASIATIMLSTSFSNTAVSNARVKDLLSFR